MGNRVAWDEAFFERREVYFLITFSSVLFILLNSVGTGGSNKDTDTDTDSKVDRDTGTNTETDMDMDTGHGDGYEHYDIPIYG